ncbi:MAG: OmpA family protein [Flavobacteriaceae bacterium]|nr:OmpA family protein [Flavobacteriaceae bacterium]
MKHLKKALLIFLAVASFNTINAQDEDNPWSIDISTNSVDFYPTGADFYPNATGGIDPGFGVDPNAPYLGDFFDDFFNVEDHWNTATVISRIRVGRYIGGGFGIGLAGSFNSIDKIGDYKAGDLSYFGLDFDIRYNFLHGWFDPYLLVGGGYTWLDEEGNGSLNGGLGINFWFNDFIGMNVQSMYKHSFDEDEMLPHFQHALGVVFKFGGKDTDGDGIYDKYDACPEVAGLEAFNGCPDTDGDGIQDSEDACPLEAGLAELNGCPDRDGDGIPDKDDACPDEAGLAELNGCPDADGDGVADKDDNCPNVAGPAENNGCPWPDTDGDGVLDKDDNCPNIPGPAENNGCPAVTQEVQKEITDLARAIFFNTNKATFTEEAQVRLVKISEILNEYKTVNFTVEGHTDDTGAAEYNKTLSQKRADAVRDYLVENGFPADKMTAMGYGEEKPICDTKTKKCRQANRRVDIFSENAKRD